MRALVQCITNNVTMNDCANILLAAGASPTMAHHIKEVEEVQTGCDALVCNLGATDDFEAMRLAVKTASSKNHPVVVDPVGVGGSTFRREFFFELCKEGNISVVRGNYSEISALAKHGPTVTGVDAALPVLEEGSTDNNKISEAVLKLSKELNCIVAASGETDYISDGNKVITLTGGNSIMSRITGTGCMSSVLLGAYLVWEGINLSAVENCLERINECGELAAKKTEMLDGGTMTFRMNFIDEISKAK